MHKEDKMKVKISQFTESGYFDGTLKVVFWSLLGGLGIFAWVQEVSFLLSMELFDALLFVGAIFFVLVFSISSWKLFYEAIFETRTFFIVRGVKKYLDTVAEPPANKYAETLDWASCYPLGEGYDINLWRDSGTEPHWSLHRRGNNGECGECVVSSFRMGWVYRRLYNSVTKSLLALEEK